MIKPLLILGLGASLFSPSFAQEEMTTPQSFCELPGLHQDIKANLDIHNKNPADINAILNLSNMYQALGMGEEALGYANLAIQADPTSGSAMVAKIHAMHLLGQVDEALKLAQQTYEGKWVTYTYGRGEKSWLRHSILAMMLEAGDLTGVEARILAEYPKVIELIDKPAEPLSLNLGVPLHTLEPLIDVFRATDRVEWGDKLRVHLQGFTAQTFFDSTDEEIAATQNWFLASIWAGLGDQRVVPALTMAYEKGFRMGWRFNYAHHPVYWTYQADPEFLALITRIEADMAREAACLE